MTELILRLIARYLTIPIATLLAAWFGLPGEITAEIVKTLLADPDFLVLASFVLSGIAGVIEVWTMRARKNGRKT